MKANFDDQTAGTENDAQHFCSTLAQGLGAIFLSVFLGGLALLGGAMLIWPLVLLVSNSNAVDFLR